MAACGPHGSAYVTFPDGPEHYREAAWDATLKQLFHAAVTHAEDRIRWYDVKAAERSRVAKGIRLWSLIFFALGTIAPILLTFFVRLKEVAGAGGAAATLAVGAAKFPLTEAGYVLLAFAGALVIFDQFFDASGSWMRFRQSQARLEVLLAELRFAWAGLLAKSGGGGVDREQAAKFVDLLREFVTKVELLAEQETNEWARRFNQRIESFDRNPNLKVSLDSGQGTPPPADAAAPKPKPDGAAGTTGTTGAGSNAPPTDTPMKSVVRLRVVVEDANGLDEGSLQMLVDDAPVSIQPHGMIELPLEVGRLQTVVATGRLQGRAVTGQVEVTPTVDDEGRALAIELA